MTELGASGEGGLHLAVLATARSSALLFLAVFLAAPLRALRSSSAAGGWLVRNRPYTTLAFAASHALHLGAVLAYLQAGGPAPGAAPVAAGALGYAWIAALAATAFDRTATGLTPRRRRQVQLVGLYYLWAVFAAFFAAAIAKERPDAPAFATLFGVALLARLWLLRQGREVRDGVVG